MYLLYHNPKNPKESLELLHTEVVTFLNLEAGGLEDIRITGNYDPAKEKPQNQDQMVYEHLYIALINPEKLGAGSCKIEADGNTVYEVEKGEILVDEFKIHNYFEWREEQELKSLMREAVNNIYAPELKRNLTKITKAIGNKQKDGSVQLKGNIYNFELQKSGELKIIARNGNREIFNKTGFTDKTSSEEFRDIEALSSLFEKAQQESNNQKQKPLRPEI